MAGESSIEWTDATWNPTRGCTCISPGCKHCYAMKVAARFSGPGLAYEGLAFMHPKAGGQWTGKLRLVEDALDAPLRWSKPRRIFVNSMSDLFHEALTIEQIARVFAVMYLAPRHTFQVLTKRASRMREVLTDPRFYRLVLEAAGELRRARPRLAEVGISDPTKFPAPWVHLGVSVENAEYLWRLDELRATPAGLRFVSCEPLLADLGDINLKQIDWVIVGGESGAGARPFDTMWAVRLVRQCDAQGAKPFVKQLGAVPYDSLYAWLALGKNEPANQQHAVSIAGWQLDDPKGGDMAEWQRNEALRPLCRREFPEVRRA